MGLWCWVLQFVLVDFGDGLGQGRWPQARGDRTVWGGCAEVASWPVSSSPGAGPLP